MGLISRNAELNEKEFADRKKELRSYPVALGMPDSKGICNARCNFCWEHNYSRNESKKNNDINSQPFPAKYKRIVEKELMPYAKYINYTGAHEIFLDKKAVEEILRPNEERVYYIATNGALLPNYLDEFVKCDNRFIFKLSLNASNARLHKKITHLNNFNDIITAAKKYAGAIKKNNKNVLFAASMVVMKSNIDDMISFYKLCKDIGFMKVDYIMLRNKGYWEFSKDDFEFNYYKELPSWEYDKLVTVIKSLIEMNKNDEDIQLSFACTIEPDLKKTSILNIRKKSSVFLKKSLYFFLEKAPWINNAWDYLRHSLFNDLRLLLFSIKKRRINCDYPWKIACIEKDGTVRLCYNTMYPIGRINSGDIHKSIWNGWRIKRIRKLMKNNIIPGCCTLSNCTYLNPHTEKNKMVLSDLV